MKLVQKLTIKTLGWARNAIENELEELPKNGELLIGRIAGIVSDFRRTMDDKTGEIQLGLKGQFKGMSSKDVSEPIVSGVCYLPSGLQAMIEGALSQAKEQNPAATVRFAMDIYAHSDTNQAGYTFRGDNLIEAEGNDAVDDLLVSATNVKPLAIAAPKPAAKAKGE